MTKLSIGMGLAILDAVSLGCVAEQANWSTAVAALFASTLSLWPGVDELAGRMLRGDES